MSDGFIQAYGCEVRQARLVHKCCECRGAIAVGEKYHYHHGIYDGAGVNFKRCVDCEKMADEINATCDQPECGVVGFEGIGEWVFGSDHLPWIARFVETKRRRGAAVEDWMLRRVEGQEDL